MSNVRVLPIEEPLHQKLESYTHFGGDDGYELVTESPEAHPLAREMREMASMHRELADRFERIADSIDGVVRAA